MMSDEIKFENGSYIIGIDLASTDAQYIVDGKVVRGQRANLFVYDDMITPKWYRRWLRRFIEKIRKGE